MQAELNPCPFCTSQPYRDKQGYVRCVSSDCPMRVLTMHETVWNTRPIPTPADCAKWEALREAVEEAIACGCVDGQGMAILRHALAAFAPKEQGNG